MVNEGDTIPSVEIMVVTAAGHETVLADKLFANKRVVLFGLPGAFTPTCSNAHLPGYVVLADKILAKGVDMIACVSVNDVHVMRAWGEQQNAEQITLIADASAALTTAMGLGVHIPIFGGVRSQRYAMIIDRGVVNMLNLEAPAKFEVSDAETILNALSE